LYAESAPHSNPVLTKKSERKYSGIGAALIAFGIKYSIDNGGPKRFMLADEAAWKLFSEHLVEEVNEDEAK
jgi:hypothetical protein